MTDQTPMRLDQFMTGEQLLKALSISRRVLYAWIDSGLPFIRVGAKLFFLESAVAEWLARQQKIRDPSPSVPRTSRHGDKT